MQRPESHGLEPHFTEEEVPRTYKIAKATLRKKRWLGEEPDWVKFGKAVRYPLSSLLEWAKKGGE
jgi:hypothetical protein